MSADTDMVDLKPCPFCGGEPALALAPCPEPIAYVTCECGANGADFFETDDGDEYAAKAITAWNTRAALDASGIGELVAENRELRNIIASLGYCAPEASLEFMRLIPGEVALSRARATVGNGDG